MQDGSMWDWFTPAGRADTATEITYPKQLLQQTESEEEMAHDQLDTRVKNNTGDSSVSFRRRPLIELFLRWFKVFNLL